MRPATAAKCKCEHGDGFTPGRCRPISFYRRRSAGFLSCHLSSLSVHLSFAALEVVKLQSKLGIGALLDYQRPSRLTFIPESTHGRPINHTGGSGATCGGSICERPSAPLGGPTHGPASASMLLKASITRWQGLQLTGGGSAQPGGRGRQAPASSSLQCAAMVMLPLHCACKICSLHTVPCT